MPLGPTNNIRAPSSKKLPAAYCLLPAFISFALPKIMHWHHPMGDLSSTI